MHRVDRVQAWRIYYFDYISIHDMLESTAENCAVVIATSVAY